jgi:hypothetical protein
MASWRCRVRERAGIVVAVLLVGSILLGPDIGCSRPASPADTAVLETMRQLTVAQVLTKDAIERTLEADLAIDANNSSEMVTFYLGRPRSGSRFEKTVKLIDLRVPTAQNTVMGDPFLVIELHEGGGLTADDAERVLGRPSEVNVPEPNDVTALSYIYAFGPHRLWISMGHGQNKPLHGLAINRNEAR